MQIKYVYGDYDYIIQTIKENKLNNSLKGSANQVMGLKIQTIILVKTKSFREILVLIRSHLYQSCSEK